jgi:sarcosine oxidase
MERVDAVVVGAGINGAATAAALAQRGHDVVVLEQHALGHERGSSHGATRIFRFAYAEPQWVELARRALDGWRELEARAGEPMLSACGGLDHGDAAQVRAVAAALAGAGRPHELLDATDAEARWPGFRFEGPVCWSPDTARVHADRALHAFLTGITVHEHVAVERIEPTGDDAIVHTANGSWRAGAVVVAAGAWVEEIVADTAALPPLRITEEHVQHFPPAAPLAPAPDVWPCCIHYRTDGRVPIYSLLTPGEGVKVAEHGAGRVLASPGDRPSAPDPARFDTVARYVAEWMPALIPEAVTRTTCLYTSTPDESFVVERRGPIVVVSACSGHAFKFAPAIGEHAADLVETAQPA